nr:ATP-binding protein [Pseudomonas chengduensis]
MKKKIEHQLDLLPGMVTSQNPQASQLDLEQVDDLLILCEEVMRATPEGSKRFIEPAPGVLSRAKSKQHNIIFGRRGSGKSSLLRKTAADLTLDRRPIAFVDMETFKGHTYPDVLISVLIKSLHEFKKWIDTAATTPASKKSFWHKLFGTLPLRPPVQQAQNQRNI